MVINKKTSLLSSLLLGTTRTAPISPLPPPLDNTDVLKWHSWADSSLNEGLMKPKLFFISMAVAVFGLMGCATTVHRAYDGGQRPQEQVEVIKTGTKHSIGGSVVFVNVNNGIVSLGVTF